MSPPASGKARSSNIAGRRFCASSQNDPFYLTKDQWTPEKHKSANPPLSHRRESPLKIVGALDPDGLKLDPRKSEPQPLSRVTPGRYLQPLDSKERLHVKVWEQPP